MSAGKTSHRTRYSFATIGAVAFVYSLVTGVHDIHIAAEGMVCVDRILGPEYVDYRRKQRKRHHWNNYAIDHLNSLGNPALKKQALEAIKEQCTESIFVTVRYTPQFDGKPTLVEDHITVRNWDIFSIWRFDPANPERRWNWIKLFALFTFLCVVDLKRLPKIFIWSQPDDYKR